MLVEKRAFKRFLSVYIISSIFLLSVGSWLYYQVNYQLILSNKISHMKKDIDLFIKTNLQRHYIYKKIKPDFLGLPISIYKDKIYLAGSFKLSKEELSKEYFRHNDRFYYIHKEHKKWGEVYVAMYSDIGDEIESLVDTILIFFIISTLFIIAIAYVLGKIFLKPMHDAIKSLEDFIADATHELNTPISNILANIELAQELYPECKSVEEFKKIESSAFRISKIFKDLSFVRLEHEREIEKKLINVSEVLNERIEFFQTLMENKNLQIDKKIVNTSLHMDSEDLTRLIDNLLSNAIKYSPINGLIEIELNDKYFSILNEGVINEKENILKKFVRDNQNEGGFGLGLYIVEKICTTYDFKFSILALNDKVKSKVIFS